MKEAHVKHFFVTQLKILEDLKMNTTTAVICCILVLMGKSFANSTAEYTLKTKNIMVLHSYHQGLQWTDNISAGIQSEFKDLGKDVELHYEYLDTKRNPGEDYFKSIVEFEKQKIKLSNIPFEAIICCDNNALRFILENRNDLYPNIPIVFCGINNFSLDMLNGQSNITGVAESMDYASTLDIMIKFHPERKHILVILDKTPTGIAIKKEFLQTASKYTDFLEFEYFQDFTLAEVPAKISSLNSSDAIFLLTFNRDKENNFISYIDGIRMIQSESQVPIYGSWDFYFGNGIIGGMITSGFYQGLNAAKLVKQILKGIPADELPILTQSPNQFMFDYKQMKKFGIKKKDIPTDGVIINLPPTFIERHAQHITVITGIIIIILPLLTWRLFAQKRKRKALEKLTIELDKRLESAMSEVKILSGFLPICTQCKKIRDDKGNWTQVESYIDKHSEAEFSHGMCPDCCEKTYGKEDWYKEKDIS
jgi:ABC-type uncharacterized transport system substrate-binding protein